MVWRIVSAAGKRVMRSYTDFEKAKTEADAIADKRSSKSGDDVSLTLRGPKLSEYVAAMDLLPSGIALNVAVMRVAEAVKILGSDRIIEAARFFDKKHPAKLPQKTVLEIVDELIESKRSFKRGDRYIADLRYRLGAFADSFKCNLSSVTSNQIQEWLHGLKLSPQSYLNFRTVIGTLFKFAKRRGYLTKDNDEIEQTEKVDGNGGTIEVYTPAEMKRLLCACPAPFKPSLAIAAFAGLRSSEIERLDWRQVDLQRRFITVIGARKRGTPSRRVVPVSDNLAAILAPHAEASGKVWDESHDEFYDAQQATAAATARENLPALEWKHNALRHSFISYRLAEVQNINQVALEAGNSATTIHAHYKELVTPEQAKEWFALL